MKLAQLEAFVETCRTGSYTRAADRLYISQPALHHQVKQLEDELGVSLLVARDRRMIPTADGEVVLAVAEHVLQEVRELEGQFKQRAGSQAVRAGTTMLLAAAVLPAPVTAFRSEHPDIPVQIVALELNEIYEALQDNRIDFAVTSKRYSTNDIALEPLVEWEDVCVAAQDHPLVDGRLHSPGELLAYPIALTERGVGARGRVEDWFRAVAGVDDLSVAFEARTGALLAQAVASSPDLVTFLPRPALRQFRLGEILVDGPRVQMECVLCYLRSRPRRRAVDLFLSTLRSWAGSQEVPPVSVE